MKDERTGKPARSPSLGGAPILTRPLGSRTLTIERQIKSAFTTTYITQFSQPDPIIPDLYNPLDWNRYQYARSNPLKYTDPSGHDVDCAIGENECKIIVRSEQRYGQTNYRDYMRQDNLFARLFTGQKSGKAKWTTDDWEYYYSNRGPLWDNPPGGESREALQTRLWLIDQPYGHDQYVNDIGLIFGGMPTVTENQAGAAWESMTRSPLPFLNVPNPGRAGQPPGQNQSHHWAAFFFVGYYYGRGGAILNTGREIWTGMGRRAGIDFDDIALGNSASYEGYIYYIFTHPVPWSIVK